MYYRPLQITLLQVSGVFESLKAMRLPKNDSISDSNPATGDIGGSDARLAKRLIKAGDSHAKAMRGIIACIELHLQAEFMIEFETYRYVVECLSPSSPIHNELKFLSGVTLAADQEQADLSNKVYTRIVTANYQALRRMYLERRHHRHPDWQIVCAFIEQLPYFHECIYPEERRHALS